MLIDWFTVAAQALNFLILVWLMKRFLYKPVLLAIDTREKRIATELADAAAKLAEAQKQGDLYRGKTEAFDKQRADLLQKATDDAGAEGRNLLDEARKSADLLTVKRREAEKTEALAQAQSIARRTGEEVFAITRQAFTDLASSSLEERMVDIFLQRLRDMAGKAKQNLSDALTSATEPAVLRSAFDLPAPQRAIIETALSEIFAAKIPLRYEIAPDLISGIDLSANGRKVAWSMADYLRSLEKSHPALAGR